MKVQLFELIEALVHQRRSLVLILVKQAQNLAWVWMIMLIIYVKIFSLVCSVFIKSCLSLSRHEQVCLIRLPFERYFTYYPQTKCLCRAYLKTICRPGRKQWNLWIRRNCAMWLIKIIRQIKLIRQKNLYGCKGDDFT